MHTAMVYVIKVMLTVCSQAVSITYMTYAITPDNGQRNCLKHVKFYSKNKFQKLVHPVGFIIGIYHDAWSPECQTLQKFIILLSFDKT